jgi:hypothetical protein
MRQVGVTPKILITFRSRNHVINFSLSHLTLYCSVHLLLLEWPCEVYSLAVSSVPVLFAWLYSSQTSVCCNWGPAVSLSGLRFESLSLLVMARRIVTQDIRFVTNGNWFSAANSICVTLHETNHATGCFESSFIPSLPCPPPPFPGPQLQHHHSQHSIHQTSDKKPNFSHVGLTHTDKLVVYFPSLHRTKVTVGRILRSFTKRMFLLARFSFSLLCSEN